MSDSVHDKAQPTAGTVLPVTVDNPDEWGAIVDSVVRRTSIPPGIDLDGLMAFVAGAAKVMMEGETAHDAELLRGHFSGPVIGQLMAFSGSLPGRTARSVDVYLVGLRPGNDLVVRVRATLTVVEPTQELTPREQFWDIQLTPTLVVKLERIS